MKISVDDINSRSDTIGLIKICDLEDIKIEIP